MILADTSVWVDHFRLGVPRFRRLLLDRRILIHRLIIGELACGDLSQRGKTLEALQRLPLAPEAKDDEVLLLIEQRRLWGRGIGWIDAHLLASALLTGARLWTLDEALRSVAANLDVSRLPV